jgi:hypothetical protein
VSAAKEVIAPLPVIPANQPDVTLVPAVAANEVAPRCAPGSVRVIIRQPEDAAVGTTMKKFVQGFAKIALRHLRAANDSRAPIDLMRAP